MFKIDILCKMFMYLCRVDLLYNIIKLAKDYQIIKI